jgi:HYR domain
VTRRLLIGVTLLLSLLPAALAFAQAAPLTATLSFVNPPPNQTYTPTTPIKLNLLLTNASGAPLITISGFSQTEFWRNMYFDLEGVGTFTDANASAVHSFVQFGTCHYRKSQVLPGSGIQVTPVEVLPANFAVQFSFDDARTHFDLSRSGVYTVNARITFVVYDSGAVINDCNIEFGSQSLVSIGDKATLGRQELGIVSNSLQFTVLAPGGTPPTTTVVASSPPNAAGWNSTNVGLTFTATDVGGPGVDHITVTVAGPQPDTLTLPGSTGVVDITTEGISTVTYSAVDSANNAETPRSVTVRIDKTPPVVTPPASVSVTATESGGARGSASPTLAAFLAAGSATDNLDPAPVRLTAQVGGVNADNNFLFPIGTTTVTFRFQDQAGNIGTATANVTVTPGTPAVSVAIAGSGVRQARVFFYDLRFTNTGTATATSVTLQQVAFKTLSGHGNVTYNPGFSPALPVALGDLPSGASTTLRIYVTVPAAVQSFSMTESGQFKNSAGATMTFSRTQTVTP